MEMARVRIIVGVCGVIRGGIQVEGSLGPGRRVSQRCWERAEGRGVVRSLADTIPKVKLNV
jgi:hypothetical protein